jgi:hypothetical protein
VTVSGVVSYGGATRDSRRIVLAPGVFRHQIGGRVPVLIGHDTTRVVGTAMIDEGVNCLRFVAHIEDSDRAFIASLFHRGAIHGVSPGWCNEHASVDFTGRRVVRRADLREVSLMIDEARPAFAGTHATLSIPFYEVSEAHA